MKTSSHPSCINLLVLFFFVAFGYYAFINKKVFEFIDLASSALGTTVVAVTDEFFAPATMMINPEPALFLPDKFVGNVNG
jgi:allantoicase